ncbi:hypothetical protein [Planosporangium mesophilum]|uniref:Uncharacterized protein n=1 Tax=Planosporangium mesophilum TaxID=689768 RepID=A0A8J3X3G6_9ACTN|nr:hypothetical protein [Planosporangium mesophilum]NJC82535.1 hypothetical protein [Planosporangium mesophilum]GII25459.1 hypothetical protein Pme01_50560 [Planosporangium mesophilum]
MQVKATAVTATATVSLFKPLRLNFAQVCMYCGVRWCESPRCVEMHNDAIWIVCADCDGFGTLVGCRNCMHGVVESDRAGLAEQNGRTLPDRMPDDDGYQVSTTAPAQSVNLAQLRDAIHGLTYGEVALAICASDMPTERPRGVTEDPSVYIVQGLARLGMDALKRQHAENMRLVDVKYHGADKQTRRTASAAHFDLWGGRRRFNRAHDLADQYWHALA